MLSTRLPHLGAAHGARLDVVLLAPELGELGRLPALVDGQQRQVVAVRLEELGLLLIRLRVTGKPRASAALVLTVHTAVAACLRRPPWLERNQGMVLFSAVDIQA